MKMILGVTSSLALLLVATPSLAEDDVAAKYGETVARIVTEATTPAAAKSAWNRLAELTDRYPARLSGSKSLDDAVAWTSDHMKRDGLKNVRVDEVMVPHWVRGAESAIITAPYEPQALAIAALGGSVGTGQEGIEAQVIVVDSFEALDARAAEVKGKIVVYNVVYDESMEPLAAYRKGTQYRGDGASRAARLGAVAALVRSVGPIGHRTPHTGSMRYADDAPKIPVAGLAAEDAAKLQRMQDRGDPATVRLTLGATMLPDAKSGNVIAELPGRGKPDETVLLACHLDSWDLSSGAMDDAGGCVAMWEAVRVIKRLELKPRRTIRVVLYTNEENGGRGGAAYLNRYRDALPKHVLAIESDDGVLPIRGYGFIGSVKARDTLAQIVSLLAPLGGTTVDEKFSGADVAPLSRGGNVPVLSPTIDMRRYFYLHHTNADTMEKIAPSELATMVAAVAAIAYVVADTPEPLSRIFR